MNQMKKPYSQQADSYSERVAVSVLGLHNDLCTEYSPFPCESLVHFLDFGLAGVSGHSKNFVGIELGRRC